jgi:phage replication-related protein YjqB (UPF0714/DUF867 family)
MIVGAARLLASAEGREPATPAEGPGFEATILAPLKGQAELVARKEHCSADADRLRAIGRAVGQQVRVYRDDSDVALFTVSEARDEDPDTIVRMGKMARDRLGTPGEFPARVLPFGPHPTLTDAEARRRGEFVERSDGDGTGLLVLAPHGGDIEPPTDAQAERLAAALAGKGKGVTSWRCKGWAREGGRPASARWHITSTDISEASFPLLGRVAGRRFDYAVSFHGMARDAILIGGAGPMTLKEELRAEIGRALEGSGIPVLIGVPGEANGGISPQNIVNRYCRGTGIQIEQSPRARRDHWRAIADAVARVYAAKL